MPKANSGHLRTGATGGLANAPRRDPLRCVVTCINLSADVPSLTAREKECICWVAKGKSSWDIGAILGISECTVDSHIKIAMKKLGTGNRMVAAKKAKQLGLIAPQFC
ncbi:hypothetical protein GOA89_32640 [Sinorhizobium meliloti]|nr:hypothetical protein [Sinorhizobium meliloti]MDW9850866.1 hypothetical protein [Sinorhizobium meliloti]MDX0147662.1 hypothetical protein [Sinorhizobium meliloti]MDX0153931.1 hypothetical protein [Sinorhizobium meliloti]MDX0172844.1 hypothetical protein [Sinorhizobium meliloti]